MFVPLPFHGWWRVATFLAISTLFLSSLPSSYRSRINAKRGHAPKARGRLAEDASCKNKRTGSLGMSRDSVLYRSLAYIDTNLCPPQAVLCICHIHTPISPFLFLLPFSHLFFFLPPSLFVALSSSLLFLTPTHNRCSFSSFLFTSGIASPLSLTVSLFNPRHPCRFSCPPFIFSLYRSLLFAFLFHLTTDSWLTHTHTHTRMRVLTEFERVCTNACLCTFEFGIGEGWVRWSARA